MDALLLLWDQVEVQLFSNELRSDSSLGDIFLLEESNRQQDLTEDVISYLDMRVFDIVPLWSLVDELHILPRNLRFHRIDHARVEFDQERTNVLMVSSVLIIKAFAYNTLCDVGGENVLEVDIQTDNFLPERVKRTHDGLGIFGLTIAIEADHWIAIAFHVGRREIFTLIKVKHKSVPKLFLVIILNRLVFGSSVGVKIDPAGKIPSNFFRAKQMKRLIALKFIDMRVFVPRTGEDCASLDSDEAHAVVLLLSVAEVDDDIWHLLDILGELHFLVV